MGHGVLTLKGLPGTRTKSQDHWVSCSTTYRYLYELIEDLHVVLASSSYSIGVRLPF